MLSRRERIEGALLGLLVGDALGVPYEFHDASEIPSFEELEYEPPVGFERAHVGTPVGTWSDDGAQALCLLASLLHCGHLDAEDFGRRLLSWYEQGYMAVDARVFDVGNTTIESLRRLQSGVSALESGVKHSYAKGNGSLMRVLPLVLWHKGSDEQLVRDAELQSRVTHGHVMAQVCCALYCLWARKVLEGHEDAWGVAVLRLKEIYATDELRLTELMTSVCPLEFFEVSGSGYVLDCLHSAKVALVESDFEGVVKRSIAFGNDTDTTACVAGGIAGLKFGIKAIPARWIRDLRGRELYMPLLDSLLASFA